MTKLGEAIWSERDGGPPAMLEAHGAPGESGVSVLRLQFRRVAHFKAAIQHLIFLQLSPHLRLDCRIGDSRLRHETATGALAICPAGTDCSVEADASADLLLVAVKPGQVALTAAENLAIEARLCERLAGYDPALLSIAGLLAYENDSNHPGGTLFWNGAAQSFIRRLVVAHTKPLRARLGPIVLKRIRDYIHDHLADPIEVNDLAALAARSPFHFSRVFARSIGMTPYRYVVHRRLQIAIDRIRSGMSLAEVAADTGFSDQSHLSRWIRRVHGVAPSELA
ncbi:helix-turn-helix transcriptional regulator [Bradyrhizobium lablabi]|uniref:AraC family transcriptional regulator n=1 Tax=Bradyrhizobium lablabi TaxID=722472 RepID=UPI001BACE093|nr:AraC family transcriptional regulator [Bradyrhizobium lablabi]MBR1121504.1 helix-turn-helix transcriptional regulator [Bradyrhizobium lablabi]